MIQNKLILYCSRLEQAMLWEVCKNRRCQTSNCLFKKIESKFGENLWSDIPTRFSSVTAIKEQLETLTKPMPIVRTPILDPSPIQRHRIVEKQEISDNEEEIQQLPSITGRTPITSLSDILKDEIIKLSKGLTSN